MATDPGPMARLESVKADADAPGVIFQRLTADEPQSLAQIAKAWGVPKGRFVEWFTMKHAELYDAALKVRAADFALDAMNAALEATPETVAVAKLRADVALKLASKWDRARYGEAVKIERSVTIGMDAGLVGTAGALLATLVRRSNEKVVSGDVMTLPNADSGGRVLGTVTIGEPAELI